MATGERDPQGEGGVGYPLIRHVPLGMIFYLSVLNRVDNFV